MIRSEAHGIDLALDSLTSAERRAISAAAAERRDLTLGAGAGRLADLWHALAVAAAEANDRESATLRAMADQLDELAP